MFGCCLSSTLLLFCFFTTSAVCWHHVVSPAERYQYMEMVSPAGIAYVYKMRSAENFGAPFSHTHLTVNLVIGQPYDGCAPLINKCMVKGAIVLLERGECSFVTKSNNAEKAGAIAVIITDDDHENNEEYIIMIQDYTEEIVNIPAFFLRGKDGWMITENLMKSFMPAVVNIPINITRVPLERIHFPPWTLW